MPHVCCPVFHQKCDGWKQQIIACRGVVLLNGAGRIEDVQAAVEAPVAAALSSSEKEVLSAIDPEDFSSGSNTSTGQASTSSSQKAAPMTKSSTEQISFLQQVLSPLATIAKRVAVYGSFLLTKQPSRVKQVLQQVSSTCAACQHVAATTHRLTADH